MALVVGAAPLVASAHFIGNRWAYGGGLLPLYYQNNAPWPYSTAVFDAASNWYYTPTPSDLISTGGSAHIYVSSVYDTAASYWGVTRIWASHTTCAWFFCWTSNDEIPYGISSSPYSLGSGWGNYASSTIVFNRYTMDGLTSFMKEKVATHEFGHAQGLHHTTGCTSILQQGYLSYNAPQPHDFYDFDWLYPGTWSYGYAC
jgi:hypothetical protein